MYTRLRGHQLSGYSAEKQNEAKSLGRCVGCQGMHIPRETRCPTCTENHRRDHRQATQERDQAYGQSLRTEQDLPEAQRRQTRSSVIGHYCRESHHRQVVPDEQN